MNTIFSLVNSEPVKNIHFAENKTYFYQMIQKSLNQLEDLKERFEFLWGSVIPRCFFYTVVPFSEI